MQVETGIMQGETIPQPSRDFSNFVEFAVSFCQNYALSFTRSN
jgi:hypothetical protein